MDWTPKQHRCWSRLKLIFYYTAWKDDKLRFMTLTSSKDSPDIHKSFRTLVKRIRYKFGEFEYLAVKTDEGCGVYHIVFKGSFIPFRWLQDAWKDIHKAFMVNIKYVRNYPKKLASYMVNQYMSDQNAFSRYSWSWFLVFKGFIGKWKHGLKACEYDFNVMDRVFNGGIIKFSNYLGSWNIFIKDGIVMVKEIIQAPLFFNGMCSEHYKKLFKHSYLYDKRNIDDI